MHTWQKRLLTASLIALVLAVSLFLGPTPGGATRGDTLPGAAPIAGYAPAQDASTRLSSAPLTKSVTLSGTIAGPAGPVQNVRVGAGSPQDWQETTTNASGFYRITLQTDDQIWIHVRPAIATRLAQVNYWTQGVTADRTQNFTLTPGHLLSVRVTGGGAPIQQEVWLQVEQLVAQLAQGYHYLFEREQATGRYLAVLPPDIYYVTAEYPPDGYFWTSQPFDLRAADRSADLPLNAYYVHPIPYDPPVASKITIGTPDDLGEATVTGAPGAALSLAHVLLVNLNSMHQAHAISEADGSFRARIYAPPGSALSIRHGPASWRWNDLEMGVANGLTPMPGAILHVSHTHAGRPYELPFAAAGAVQYYADDPATTRNYVGAAWAITGTAGPIVVDGEWTRVLTGTYQGRVVPGLYLGGLNWTHPALGDLDGDNDLELLVGERSGRLVLYKNGGTSRSPDWRFERADYAGVNTGEWAYPALADVTGDGALDLFVGAGKGTVAVYYNDGAPAAPVWPQAPDVSLSVGYSAAPALDDLDGDGDLDLVVGHQEGKLYHFENTGPSTSPAWTLRSTNYAGVNESSGEGVQPAFVDLDGDGDRDLLLGLCGQLVWYRRGGTARNPTWARVGADPVGYGGGSCATSPGAGDWNGDGKTDLVAGEHWGVLRFFRRDGASWNEQLFDFPFDLLGDSAPALADWDNDGDPDMLVGQAHGQVHRYTNVGSRVNPAWRHDGIELTLPWTNHPHPFPAFADVDGDGDPDLFIGEGSWDGPDAGGAIRYYDNAGTPAAPDWRLVSANWLGLDVGGWSTPAFADIDGDGDLDLFVGDAQGTLTYVRNTGSVTSPRWAAPVRLYAGLDLGSYSAPAFLDVDRDGDLDILSGQEKGSLAYVRNTGTARSPAWEIVSAQYPAVQVSEHSTPAAADLNGDGKADLLIGDGDGGLNLYLYRGPGTPPSPGDAYAPGDTVQIAGTLRLHGPAIAATTDLNAISVQGWLGLLMLHDEAGKPLAAQNYFQSTMLTPSGFPIQNGGRSVINLPGAAITFTALRHVEDHAIEGTFEASLRLPVDLPSGAYRPLIWLEFDSVPSNTDWLAAYVTYNTFGPREALLPPIEVERPGHPLSSNRRLIWRLLMDDIVQGTRGAGAREDRGSFELASQITSQGAPYAIPPVDTRTGQAITYRLEPFLPMISYTDRRFPTPPLIPFRLPGGQLCVTIREPDGIQRNLGCEAFAQSFNRSKTTRAGQDLNIGTVQLESVYSLKVAPDRFRVTFSQYGHHTVIMSGTVDDLWGNRYTGGGAYDLWVAHPLDIDSGVLPGTPLAAGDAFHSTFQFYPRVPAQVSLALTHYPDSDPSPEIVHTRTGRANPYGYYAGAPILMNQPGEYRVDLTAVYTDPSGALYVGAMTWGSVVMTPPNQVPHLVAHGRRGVDSLWAIPGNAWFVSCRDLPIRLDTVSHTLNPYWNGDILWSRMVDASGECPTGVTSGGDSLILGASVQDTVGTIQAAIQARANRAQPGLYGPGDLDERVSAGELPLFTSTRSGRPPQFVLGQIGSPVPGDVDQIAYSYRSSQRPGVRVREMVAEDGQSGGYWRLDTLYDDQLGVGILGDQENDFKFQYLGVVYRDLETGRSEYLGQGSGWIFIPDSDPKGSRAMPPFAGYGAWTAEGGPILTLKGKDVHIFGLPTGTRPGAVLEVGDTFRFAGHIMPTLDSRAAFTTTAPSGARRTGSGQANSIGYLAPVGDFAVNEPGLWSVDVRVWHDGAIGDGEKVLCATHPTAPCPSGDVLGSEKGRYWFYVVPRGSSRLDVSSPAPGYLTFGRTVTPISIGGALPAGLTGAMVDYTISMPGYILQTGQAALSGGRYQITFDPVALQHDYPNLDLVGRDTGRTGLSDTISIGLLLRGKSGGQSVYRANTITLQGDRVYVGGTASSATRNVHLPLILRGLTQ